MTDDDLHFPPNVLMPYPLNALEDIENPSDRIAAIVLASFIDNLLTYLLTALLRQDRPTLKKMFTGLGPISTFSAKIELGYLIELYDRQYRNALHSIREIRNHFAHSSKLASFDNDEITDSWKALRSIVFDPKITEKRDIFIFSTKMLTGNLIIKLMEQRETPNTSLDISAPPHARRVHGPNRGRRRRQRQPQPSRE